MRIEPGDTYQPTKDYDGYPAVRVHNRIWDGEDTWITASTFGTDQEHQVRELAAALTAMADQMEVGRRAESAAS